MLQKLLHLHLSASQVKLARFLLYQSRIQSRLIAMKKVWITYAWTDNDERDVDFIIQQLDETDLEVKFDRRNLVPGQRLWTQIAEHITNPDECDAWGIVLTSDSIASPGCIEELSYALDRALQRNSDGFPIFALLHGISARDVPPALRIRLCIVLENSDWVSQVVAAACKQAVGFVPQGLSPFVLTERPHVEDHLYLEIRPRFDRFSPFRIAVDVHEKEIGNVRNAAIPGPSGRIPQNLIINNGYESKGVLLDGTPVYIWGADNEANSTNSYYMVYRNRPQRIWVGSLDRIMMIPLINL